MRSTLLILVIAAVIAPAQQAPPATEVYLLELGPAASKGWVNISNSPGYDNQPSFLPDSSGVLFSSNRDGKQTDIYRYDIATKAVKQLTSTPDSEYSPAVTPDGKTFSVIRQAAADGTQLLVKYDLATGAHHSVVFENVKPVGYHAWIDPTHVAMFILGSGQGQPATLQIADTATGQSEVIESGIGRSITIRPGAGTVTYIATGPPRMIKEFDFKTRTTKALVAPLEGSQDLVWLPPGKILQPPSGPRQFLQMASGAVISNIDAFKADRGWTQAFDLTAIAQSSGAPRVGQVTRMAVSSNVRWLAFVAEPAK